jgi:hypothetical protein
MSRGGNWRARPNWLRTTLPPGIARPRTLTAATLAYLEAAGEARSCAQVTTWLMTLYGASRLSGISCLRRLQRAGRVERLSMTHWRAT